MSERQELEVNFVFRKEEKLASLSHQEVTTMPKRNKKDPRQIPIPGGPYNVGCTDVMTPGVEDGVFFRLFYPAEMVENSKSPDWLPDKCYLKGYAMFFKVWPPLYCKCFPKHVGDIDIPASWDAPPLKLPGRQFPVIVFSHGLGGCRTSYTTFCLELASQGYVVAALEHRDYSACMSFYYETASESAPPSNNSHTKDVNNTSLLEKRWMVFKKVKSGKGEYAVRNLQVHRRAKECSMTLDVLVSLNSGSPVSNLMETSCVPLHAFRGTLDTSRASIAGHSFGGATVIATMAKDTRFRAGLGLDTWMLPLREETAIFQKVNQPMLFINMEKFQTKTNLKVMKKMQSARPLKTVITLKGTVHLNQCDVPFLCDNVMRRLFGAHSKLNRFTAMGLTTALSNVFLSKHLGMQIEEKHEEYIVKHKDVLREGINVV